MNVKTKNQVSVLPGEQADKILKGLGYKPVVTSEKSKKQHPGKKQQKWQAEGKDEITVYYQGEFVSKTEFENLLVRQGKFDRPTIADMIAGKAPKTAEQKEAEIPKDFVPYNAEALKSEIAASIVKDILADEAWSRNPDGLTSYLKEKREIVEKVTESKKGRKVEKVEVVEILVDGKLDILPDFGDWPYVTGGRINQAMAEMWNLNRDNIAALGHLHKLNNKFLKHLKQN